MTEWNTDLRVRLVATLSSLADPEYQRRVWIEGHREPGNEDCFDEDVHFLFDDTCLADDPDGALGVFLRTADEVQLLRDVVEAVDDAIEAVGRGASDAEYVVSQQWARVVAASSAALLVLRNSDQASVRE